MPNQQLSDVNERAPAFLKRTSGPSAYTRGLLVVLVCTLVAHVGRDHLAESNLVMIYLLGVVLVASRFGRGPSIVASILSVAAFDFFFVMPHLTFAVADTQYLVTFGVMLTVALVISTLTNRLHHQVEVAHNRERRTAALYAMSRDLASTRGLEALVQTALHHIGALSGNPVAVWLPDEARQLHLFEEGHSENMVMPEAQAAARWVFEWGRMAGTGMEMWAESEILYVPLIASRGTVGVLALHPASSRQVLAPEPLSLLEALAAQTALAVERARLSAESEHTRVQMETEQLRNTLLSSVSHDLRTPLAAITGAASALLQDGTSLSEVTRSELAQSIHDEAYRLNRLLSNLLDMTRLESGAVQVHKEWYPLEELVGAVLARLDAQLQHHPVTIRVDQNLPLVPLDEVLVEQVLINILENAIKYTPSGSPIAICALPVTGAVQVEITDAGPGLPPGDEQRIFDKFYRGRQTNLRHGAGLGLTIARAIVEAHGGRIWAETLPGGGTVFRFTLPTGEGMPTIAEEPNELPGES